MGPGRDPDAVVVPLPLQARSLSLKTLWAVVSAAQGETSVCKEPQRASLEVAQMCVEPRATGKYLLLARSQVFSQMTHSKDMMCTLMIELRYMLLITLESVSGAPPFTKVGLKASHTFHEARDQCVNNSLLITALCAKLCMSQCVFYTSQASVYLLLHDLALGRPSSGI